MMEVLDECPSCSWMVFVTMSFAGLMEDWLGFFIGIESLDKESSLAAASTSLAVLGMRMLKA